MLALTPFVAAFVELASSPRTGALLVLLAVAATIDWRTYRIPNVLTFGGMVMGLTLSMFDVGSEPSFGLLSGIGGLLLATGALLPLYAFRVLGAGDVKLMAAVGAFVGHDEILPVLLFVLITAGLVSLAIALYHRALPLLLSNVLLVARAAAHSIFTRRPASDTRIAPVGRLPCASCILFGTSAFLAGARMGAW